MLPPPVIPAPDFSLLRNAQQTLYRVSEMSGHTFYPTDLSAANKAGYLKPILVAGRKLYYLPDIDAFAVKWGAKKVAV